MLSIFLFLLSVSDASAEGTWLRTAFAERSGSTPQEIGEILDKYPQFLSPSEASGAELVVARSDHFRFAGPTTCLAGDPRLEQEVVSLAVRIKHSAEIKGARSGVHTSGMITTDPCAEDLPPAGRWALRSETRTEFTNHQELAEYLRGHRENFAGLLPHHLTSATEVSRTFHWEGASSCSAGDPRLTLIEDAGVVTFSGDGSEVTFASSALSRVGPCRTEPDSSAAFAAIIDGLRRKLQEAGNT